MPRSPSTLALVLLCLAIGLVSFACDAQAPATEDPAAETASAANDPVLDPEREARKDAFVSRMWWNQAQRIGSLRLTETQRRAMDARAKEFLGERGRKLEALREVMRLFGEALQTGDREAARETSWGAAGIQGDLQQAQMAMIADVMAELTPEQRATLAETSPGLFGRLWVRPGPTRTGGPRRRPGTAAGEPD